MADLARWLSGDYRIEEDQGALSREPSHPEDDPDDSDLDDDTHTR